MHQQAGSIFVNTITEYKFTLDLLNDTFQQDQRTLC